MQRVRTASCLLQSIGAAVCVFALVMTLGCFRGSPPPFPPTPFICVCLLFVSLRAFSVFYVHTSPSDQPGRPHCSSHGLSQADAPPPTLPCQLRAQMKLDRVATGSLALFAFSIHFLSPPRETSSPGGGWGGSGGDGCSPGGRPAVGHPHASLGGGVGMLVLQKIVLPPDSSDSKRSCTTHPTSVGPVGPWPPPVNSLIP